MLQEPVIKQFHINIKFKWYLSYIEQQAQNLCIGTQVYDKSRFVDYIFALFLIFYQI